MALITARVQHSAVRAIKHVFRPRDKYCCAEFYSNLPRNRIIRNRIHDSSLEPNDPSDDPKIMCDSKYPITMKERQIVTYLGGALGIKEELVWIEIIKHPKRKFLSICQVQKSLNFLKQIGFSKQVISDLPAICFYPQGNIAAGLEEITRNAVDLHKFGYVNGFLKGDIPGSFGFSKSKDKRLHLCLYYVELPFNFNGNGIFSIDVHELNSSETKQQQE